MAVFTCRDDEMRRPLIAGNWKMNGLGAQIDEARAVVADQLAAGDIGGLL